MRRRLGVIFMMCLLIVCSGCAVYGGYGYYDYPYSEPYHDYDDYYYPHNYYLFFKGDGERHERHETRERERHEERGRMRH